MSPCSISVATGVTSRAMNRRTVSISSRRTSGSVSAMVGCYERTGPEPEAGTLERRMMDHRTIMGFQRDEATRQRKIDRVVTRRVWTYIRPYRRPLIAFVVAVILG